MKKYYNPEIMIINNAESDIITASSLSASNEVFGWTGAEHIDQWTW